MALKTNKIREFPVAIAVSLFAAIVFYFSTKATLHDLDYTSQIASALLHGQLGLREKPPDWLNEMIPQGERYYSAFPLGAVISMLPVALLRNANVLHSFPGHILASLIAGLCVYFFWRQPNGTVFTWKNLEQGVRKNSPVLIRFLSLPAILALATAAYNFVRFRSIFDFGYIHIPEVAQEPWYQHGLFSIHAIPWN